MPYTPYHADWRDYPDTTTPVDAAAMEHIETWIGNAHTAVDRLKSTFVNVLDYGALADDSTDNTAAFASAALALTANGGVLFLPKGTYRGSISVTANKPTLILGPGAKLRPLSGQVGVTFNTTNGDAALGWTLEGLSIDGSIAATATTAVKVLNSDRIRLRDVRIDDCGVGVLAAVSASSQWVEGLQIQGAFISGCTKGIHLDGVTSPTGSPSFGEMALFDVGVQNCTTGVHITQYGVAYRTVALGLTIWIPEGGVGVRLAGDIYRSQWQVGFEVDSVSAATAIKLDSTALNTATWDLMASFTGSTLTQVDYTSSTHDLHLRGGTSDVYMFGDNSRGLRAFNPTGAYPVVSVAGLFTGGGGILFGGATGAPEVTLYRNASAILESAKQFYAVGGLTTKTKAGVPSDSDTDMDQDGTIILDTTNHRLYYRSGGTWRYPAAGSAPSLTAALPGSPADGDEIIFTDSLTAGTYHWHLRYVSGRASNKWVFVGGAPATAEVTTDEGTASDSYAALATAGPSFALPLAGDYQVTVGAQSYNATSGVAGIMSYDIGGTGAVDADAYYANEVGNGNGGDATRTRKKTGLTAVTLTAKYKRRTAVGNTQFKNRWMSVLPVALGG